MKFIKRTIVIVLSLFISMGNCFAITEDEFMGVMNFGDVGILYQFEEVMPTTSSPYRLNINFASQEILLNNMEYSLISLTKEEYQALKVYQDIITQYNLEYQSKLTPLMVILLKNSSEQEQISSDIAELKLSLNEENDPDRRQQILEQIDSLTKKSEELEEKYNNNLQNILEIISSIDSSVMYAFLKMNEFANLHATSYQSLNHSYIDITSPGYYMISLLGTELKGETTTYSSTLNFPVYRVLEVPETPKEEVVEEPDVENPSTGIQNMLIGGGVIIVTSLIGIYFIRKKKIFVK